MEEKETQSLQPLTQERSRALISFNTRMGMFICPSSRTQVIAFIHGFQHACPEQGHLSAHLSQHLASAHGIEGDSGGWPSQIQRYAQMNDLDWMEAYLLLSSQVLNTELHHTSNQAPETMTGPAWSEEPPDDLGLVDIHWHDSEILSVVEAPARDQLEFNVMYPVDWTNNHFEPRTIVFVDVLGYTVSEGAFDGTPTILDATVVGSADGRAQIRLGTNAGSRTLSCKRICIKKTESTATEPVSR